MIQRLLQ
jgi:hypothetical protein